MARTAKKETTLTAEERLAQALVPEAEQPYKLPENWCWSKVGAICSFERGITFPASAKEFEPTASNIPCVRTANVQDELDIADLIYIDKSYMKGNSAKLTQVNDIIMSSANSRELVGKVSFVSFLPYPMTFGGFVLTIRTKQILSKFLFYFLRYEFLLGKFMGESTQTTNIANINTTKLAGYHIPLPPLAEQQRIVDRIESLFAKLDEAKEKAQAVVDGFEDRKAAILHKAFTGELTAGWRMEHKLSADTWRPCSLIDLCEKIFDGPFGSNLKTEDYVSAGIRVVRLENLKNQWFDDSKQSYITEEKYATISGHTVYPSDLIMSTFIADETKVCQMPQYIGFAVNKADCIGIRVKNTTSTKFLLYYLSSRDVFNLLFEQLHGATRPRVNTKTIKAIPVQVPELDEQKEIVRILESILRSEEQAKETAEQVIDQIDAMKKAILARAFRGELGTNDPADESAEELLKRVL